MIIQLLFPSPNRTQLYRVVLTYWHPVRQWNTRTTQNRILNESTKSIVFIKSLVRFALLFDWNICTRDIGNMLLLPGYCNIRDCWDLLQHFAGFLLSQPPGPARMLAVATPEKIKGNKSPLRYKYYQLLQFKIKNIQLYVEKCKIVGACHNETICKDRVGTQNKFVFMNIFVFFVVMAWLHIALINCRNNHMF